MRICAVGCVMGSHELLQASLTHLALNGIKDFYLYDHDCESTLASVLSDAASCPGVRVTILRKQTPHFYQAAMVGALTELAMMDGFETVLAFDADEFWCSTIPGRTLSDQISIEMGADVAALSVPVVNYVQHRDVHVFHARSLATCRYFVVPYADSTRSCREQVDAGLPFVSMPFPSKVIARLAREIRFTEGQHGITDSGNAGGQAEASGIVVRHLPLSASDELLGKREHGRRRIDAGFGPDLGWQNQRLAHMTDSELEAYWDNNSWRLAEDQGVLVGAYGDLIEDGAFVEIERNLAAETVRCGQSSRAGRRTTATVRKVGRDKLERLLDRTLDDFGALGCTLVEGQNQLATLQSENAAIEAKRDSLHAKLEEAEAARTALQSEYAVVQGEHAALMAEHVELRSRLDDRTASVRVLQRDLARLEQERAELDSALKAIEQSESWRLTAPLRFVKRLVRPGERPHS